MPPASLIIFGRSFTFSGVGKMTCDFGISRSGRMRSKRSGPIWPRKESGFDFGMRRSFSSSTYSSMKKKRTFFSEIWR